eukprot:1158006-Pelagomonas_calceolata.AAC.12
MKPPRFFAQALLSAAPMPDAAVCCYIYSLVHEQSGSMKLQLQQWLLSVLHSYSWLHIGPSSTSCEQNSTKSHPYQWRTCRLPLSCFSTSPRPAAKLASLPSNPQKHPDLPGQQHLRREGCGWAPPYTHMSLRVTGCGHSLGSSNTIRAFCSLAGATVNVFTPPFGPCALVISKAYY